MANAQVDIQFIPNNRGGRSLVHQGYKYRVKRTIGTNIHWKCCISTCPATINTSNDYLTTVNNIHNHGPNHSKIAFDKFYSSVKDMVKKDSRSIHSIYLSGLHEMRRDEAEVVAEVVAEAPTFYSVHSSLYRARAKALPTLPSQRSEIDLPDIYTKTSNGDNFLLHSDDNMLIFSTRSNLEHLAAADTIYADGTFNICPKLFYQLYTFHAFVGQKMYPLVYALMSDKKQCTYVKLFNIVKQKCADLHLQLQPSYMMTDFETAAQNAAVNVFNCEPKGCLFHFRQSIWRNVQRFGLQDKFSSDPVVNLFVRRASALPLLRLCDIDDVWLHALEEIDMTDPAILQFADYMAETWVEAPGRAMWNHFNNDGARTTNHVEGWHSKLNKSGPCHPNRFKFISLIQKEQSCNEIVMCQLGAGGRQPPRKKKYRELDQRLRREKDSLLAGTKTPTEYADSVSHLVGL